MSKLIKVICFLFGAICFIHSSYGQGDPETFKDIGEQLRMTACSAGENKFNDLAFGLNDKSITLIKKYMKKKG
ncbi:MAG: hypothetical protein QS748_13035 [Candidatus Endonucleobacter bathymodioli]|uniref:Uncharacterized protein n=1 Tax=Candidatus Endonucleibacter bathymodioli TaxID=539814 RepID=A0AA90SE42_9GAMM|nr:hypothetical protein [Candidatus Endonucleobacter bathymodioli]